MKIIFIDIDGVLNTSDPPSGGRKPRLNKRAIDALNAVIEQVPDVRFVLSSRWRVDYGYADVVRYLKSQGLNGVFVGQTPNFDKPETRNLSPRRRYEIQKYLDDHEINSEYVIIDDNPDLGRLSSRQIRTRFNVGLTESRVADIVRLLNR